MILLKIDFIYDYKYVITLSFWILSVGFQYTVFGVNRGELAFIKLNLFQIIFSIIIPILIIFQSQTVIGSFIGISTAILSLSIIFIISKYAKLDNGSPIIAKRFLRYGLHRLPSFLGQFLIVGGIPILIVSYGSLTEAAYYNSSFSLIRFGWLAINPISIALLTIISSETELRNDKTKQLLKNITNPLLLVLFMISTQLFLWADTIMNLWLNVNSELATGTLRILALSIPFSGMTILLRNPIDALSEKGYNSIIYSISVIFAALSGLVSLYLNFQILYTFAFAYLVSQICAIILSLNILLYRFKFNIFNFKQLLYIFLIILISIITYYILVRININHLIKLGSSIFITTLLTSLIIVKCEAKGIKKLLNNIQGQSSI